MNSRVVLPVLAAIALVVTLAIVFGCAGSSSKSPEPDRLSVHDPLQDLDEGQHASHVGPLSTAAGGPKLLHAALLIRHTVRAPRLFPPNDPLLRPDLFPRGIERSTRRGLEAARNASLVWKTWYDDWLSGHPTEVFARSSQADRCSETLGIILDTWYPPPDEYSRSQVSIRMPPRGMDKYVENCGTMRYITRDYDPKKQIPDHIANQEGFHTVGDYIDFLKNKTGFHNESVNFFYMAYMEGFLSVDFEQKYTEKDHWILKYPKTREFSRLYLLHNSINVVGPYNGHYLLNGISNQLESAANGSSPFKLSLFAFHDLNLLSTLRALGIGDKPTEPLAVLAFELWTSRADQHRVLLRMSSGLRTNWVYQPPEYLTMRRPDGHVVEDLNDVTHLMRTFYLNAINTTNCGYFGDDAKI